MAWALALAVSGAHAARAAEVYWDGTSAGWDATASWSTSPTSSTPNPALVPGAADIAVFNISGANAATTVRLNANQSIAGMVFNSSGTVLFQGNTSGTTARTLTLGTSGILLNSGAGAVTISNGSNGIVNLLLAADQTWTNNASSLFTIGGPISNAGFLLNFSGSGNTLITGALSGSGGIEINGLGTVTLSGANTYTGPTTITSGVLVASNDLTGTPQNLGGGTTSVILGGATTKGTFIWSAAASATFSRGFTVNAGGGQVDVSSAAAGLTINTVGVTVAPGATFTVGGAGTTIIASSAVISGQGSFTKSGAGTATLQAANTYLGTTTLSNGLLIATNPQSLGDGSPLQLNGGTLDLQIDSTINPYHVTLGTAADATLVSNRASAGAGITHTFGFLTLGAGTLTVAAGSNATSGTPAIAFTAITLAASGTINTAAGASTLIPAVSGSGQSLSITGPGNATLAGPLNTGNGSLIKSGTGTLTLLAASSYSGSTTVSGGVLAIQHAAALGTTDTGTTVTAGGTLRLLGGINLQAEALSLEGLLASTADANTFGGAISLTDAGSITSSAGTLSITGNILNAANPLTLGGTGIGIISSEIGPGSGSLTKANAGTWTLTGANAYSGTTTVSGGVLSIQNAAALGTTTAGTSVTSGATLQLDGNITIGTEALSIAGTGAAGQNGALANLSGDNTFAGALTLTSDAAIAANAGTLALTNTSTLTGGNNDLTLTGASNGTLAAQLNTSITSLTKSGTGTWTLTGTGTYTGSTSVTAGQLTINGSLGPTPLNVSGGASLGGTGTIGSTSLSGGGVTVAASATPASRGTINLVDGALGTLTLQRNATNTALTIGGASSSQSTLNMEIGATSDQLLIGGTSRISIGTGTASVMLNLTGLGALDASTQTLISAPGGVAAGSFNNFALATTTGNFNGYSLTLASTANSLVVTKTANATPSTAYWKGSLDGTWNSFANGNSNSSNWATTADGTTDPRQKPGASTDVFLAANSAANYNMTLGQDFTINSITLTGTGTGAETNAITLNGNTLTLNATSGTGGAGIVIATGSAAHTFNSNIALGGPQTWLNNSANVFTVNGGVSGSHPLTFAGPGDFTVNGNITTGPNSLTKNGTGLLTLSGNNSYSGGININGGTVLLNSPGALGTTGTISFAGGTLKYSPNNTTDYSPRFNTTGNQQFNINTNGQNITFNTGLAGSDSSLHKAGTGALTLAATNTYTGTTTVSGGALYVNGSLAAASAVSVSNATLGGTGTINGSLELNSGAILNAAAAGTTGTLNLNTVLLKNGSLVQVDLTSAATYDQFILNAITKESGATTTLEVIDLLGGTIPFQVNDTFQIFSTGVGNAFSNIYLPSAYTWDTTKLATEGKISVLTVSVPEPGPLLLSAIAFIPAALWARKARKKSATPLKPAMASPDKHSS